MTINTITIGGRTYPATYAPRCRVCSSGDLRTEIETRLAKGHGYAQISHSLPGDHGITTRNIEDHVHNGHMPVYAPAVARIRAEEAQTRGDALEGAVEAVADRYAFLRRVIGRVDQRLLAGEIEPDVKDALSAFKLLMEIEAHADASYDMNEMIQGFIIWMEAIRHHTDAATFNAIAAEIKSHPFVAALSDKALDG